YIHVFINSDYLSFYYVKPPLLFICCISWFVFFFFFFSSRRRHTRFSRDWSSDVCSSDLVHCLARGNGQTAERGTGRPAGGGEMNGAGRQHTARAELAAVFLHCSCSLEIPVFNVSCHVSNILRSGRTDENLGRYSLFDN